MTPPEPLAGVRWKNASNQNGSCVDLALPSVGFAVRDSKNPHGPRLMFGHDRAGFLGAVKAGHFDA